MRPKLGDGVKLIRLANLYVTKAEYNFNLYRKKLEYVSKIEGESKYNGYATVEEYLPKRTIRGSLQAWLMAKGYTDKFHDQYLEDLKKSVNSSSISSSISRSSSSRSRSGSNKSTSSWPGSGGSRRRFRLKSRRT